MVNREPINKGLSQQHFEAMLAASASPFNRLLGVEVVEFAKGRAVVGLLIREEHLNPYGAVHGAAYCTLLDTVMGSVLRSLNIVGVTVDLNVNFLKAAEIGDYLAAEGEMVSEGNKIMLLRGTVFNQKEEKVSVGQGTFYRKGQFMQGENFL